MKILALDTATEALGAAVLVDGVLSERHEVIGRGHAERLLPMADALLGEVGIALGELDAIAVGRGPGAFTGVRIAISIAQGLSLASGVPLVPVSDLEALALAAFDASPAEAVVAALDARMGEVYWGLAVPVADGLVRLTREGLAAPGSVPLPEGSRSTVAAGHGFASYPELAARIAGLVAVHPQLLPSAGTIARLGARGLLEGHAVQAERAEPVYLRNDVATRSARAPAK